MSRKHRFYFLPLLAALCILLIGCVGDVVSGETGKTQPPAAETDSISIITPAPDEHRDELDAILRRSTMLEGVTVNGVSVGGMTLSEAKDAVRAALNQQGYVVHVALGEQVKDFSGEQVLLSDDLDAVLDEAFNLVREDVGFDEVSREVEAIRTQGREFTVTRSFDETALNDAVQTFADENSVAPQNAAVGYNKDENKIDFVEDVPGRSIDAEALTEALKNAASGDTVEATVTETPAEVKLSDVQAQYVLRGTKTTNFSKSIKNRKYNICKGAKLISGTILHPGDTFSANGTLGVRNKDNGWKVATAYVAGSHEKQYGGGVCQLSSTLYNAAVMADMKIVDRRNHSMPVDYVSKGLDATINSVGNIIDFKFQNSSKSDIIIIARVDNEDYTKAGKLTMEIWGIPVADDANGKYDEIRIPDPKKLKTLYPSGDVEYRVDDSKKPGYKELLVKNQNGSVWQSYVEYYLNGELVERKDLAQSTYKAYAAVYIVGPDATTPEPSDTPKPTDTVKPADTAKPTATATAADPTDKPTDQPTEKPTEAPTEKPTEAPTEKPTEAPTEKPTEAPTEKPTEKPADPPSDPGDGDTNGD